MRTSLKLAGVRSSSRSLLSSASQPTTARQVSPGVGPSFSSIGALNFGPGGVLFAADNQAATIFAIDLGALASGTTPGTKDVPALDQKIAAMVGTTPASVAITDLAVHPTSKNSFVSIRRGEGASAQPALLRIDGAGKIDLLSLASAKFTSVTLPNPAAVSTGRPERPDAVGHRSRVYQRPSLRRRVVERGVRIEAVVGGLSIHERRSRRERRDLPRESWPARDPLARHDVRAVHHRQSADDHRRLHLHTARQVPGRFPSARREASGNDDARAGCGKSADRHGPLSRRKAATIC